MKELDWVAEAAFLINRLCAPSLHADDTKSIAAYLFRNHGDDTPLKAVDAYFCGIAMQTLGALGIPPEAAKRGLVDVAQHPVKPSLRGEAVAESMYT